jgi:hypothetical protein
MVYTKARDVPPLESTFFVEVGINNGRGQAVVLRSFVSGGSLENYVHGVWLPEG